jgi:hypothetical protein
MIDAPTIQSRGRAICTSTDLTNEDTLSPRAFAWRTRSS